MTANEPAEEQRNIGAHAAVMQPQQIDDQKEDREHFERAAAHRELEIENAQGNDDGSEMNRFARSFALHTRRCLAELSPEIGRVGSIAHERGFQ